MKLPRAYAQGIFSLSLRRERNPSEAKFLRFHPPRQMRGGFSRRGIKVVILSIFRHNLGSDKKNS